MAKPKKAAREQDPDSNMGTSQSKNEDPKSDGKQNEEPQAKALAAVAKLSECGACGSTTGKGGKAPSKCTRCRVQVYCGKVCQKAHWKRHKKDCNFNLDNPSPTLEIEGKTPRDPLRAQYSH